jgi:hypothetical protein
VRSPSISPAPSSSHYRKHGGRKAAFLSARNDVFANIAIIAAGYVTALIHSALPDIIVGLGIAAMNAVAAPVGVTGGAGRGSGGTVLSRPRTWRDSHLRTVAFPLPADRKILTVGSLPRSE